jgi:uncharacterized protein YuzE
MSEPVRPAFGVRDYENNLVTLSSETWRVKAGNHKPGAHPEIRDYLAEIQRAIERPDLVFQSKRDVRSRIFYALGVGRDQFAGKHLVVESTIDVSYDPKADILTVNLAPEPKPAVAEEAAEEIWVRFDAQTHRILTIDIHNFSKRLTAAFGSSLTYTERIDPERLTILTGIPLPNTHH